MPKRVASVRHSLMLPPAVQSFRPSASKRGYDADWAKLRAQFLKDHPICSEPHCSTPARHVDHRQTVRDRPELRLAPGNLIAYCHSCHSSKTARHDGGFGNRKR